MKLIICVDIDNGISFNHRRQSRDRGVIDDIARYVGDGKVYIDKYSKVLFEDVRLQVIIATLREKEMNIVNEDYYYLEKPEDFLKFNINEIDELILYRWDKKYPADYKLDIDFEKYKLKNILEFKGNSHEKITREVYARYVE